jgi:predicted RNase H-like nuclease (RuvC/YqgF family)
MDRICDYDEAYTREDARDIGFCSRCGISGCKYSRSKSNKNVMNMSPNDYIDKIDRKDAEIRRLKKLVSELNENIKIIGRQNTKLKRKCDRYERRLTEMHFSIEADCQ